MAIYLGMFFITPYAIILMKGLVIKTDIITGKYIHTHTHVYTHAHTQRELA